MILVLLILIPLVAGLIAWLSESKHPAFARWVSLVAPCAALALLIVSWVLWSGAQQIDLPWIDEWGIRFHLALDGLSFVLVALTEVLGIASVVVSWRTIHTRAGFYYFNLMAILAGITGVFLSLDLFLFYFFWELMLVPMYFLIGIWGHENRAYATIKFFIFTQAGGLLMLLSILALHVLHQQTSGVATFDYPRLLATPLSAPAALWLMLGFFVAFAVKLPMVPLHTWLPDAHTEAPTAGSVILAGLLLKTGGYGLIRFVLPLFPSAAAAFAPVAMALGILGILYGSLVAYAQTDLKRMIAYTSVSHLGFVLLGVFSGSRLALQGTVIQMLCHGLSTGALFILVGSIQDRVHTRSLSRLGGLWEIAPRMSSAGTYFALASLGLPGLGNFIGEFLILLGTYRAHPLFGVVASLGFVVSVVYSLQIVQSVFHGPRKEGLSRSVFPDLSWRESWVMGILAILLLAIGVYPQPILATTAPVAKGALDVIR